MGDFVLTGGTSGIGAETRQQLLVDGHNVWVIDNKGGDFHADLSVARNREVAVAAVYETFPYGIDGFIPCAGLGPSTRPFSLIMRVNYFAAIHMTRELMPLLEKKRGAVVMVSSNAASMPDLKEDYLSVLKEEDETRAEVITDTLDGYQAYAGSKCALTTWMRRNSVHWAANGVRVNAVAPGITQTPLTRKIFDDDVLGDAMKQFSESVPLGYLAEPDDIANVITFLLSEKAGYISGSVIFVDGGHDAMMRPESF